MDKNINKFMDWCSLYIYFKKSGQLPYINQIYRIKNKYYAIYVYLYKAGTENQIVVPVGKCELELIRETDYFMIDNSDSKNKTNVKMTLYLMENNDITGIFKIKKNTIRFKCDGCQNGKH